MRQHPILWALLAVGLVLASARLFWRTSKPAAGLSLPPIRTEPTPEPSVVRPVADCYYTAYVTAWVDEDRDGLRSQKEPPLPGVRVFLEGRERVPTVTDAEGTGPATLAMVEAIRRQVSLSMPRGAVDGDSHSSRSIGSE